MFSKNDHLDLLAYTDANWAGDRDDRRFTSRYFTLLGGNLITWKSKKRKVVVLSSAEAKLRGIAKGLTEIIWLKKLLSELHLPLTKTCKLFCDNKVAISIFGNSVQHDHTKHVENDRHFIIGETREKGYKSSFCQIKGSIS